MTARTPRPYQERAIADLRAALASHRRVLLCLPTGGGKTFIAATIASGAMQKGKRVVFAAHRIELVQQTASTFRDAGIPCGVIAAGVPMTAEPIQVASVATLANRLAQIAPPDLLFLDEAHHAVAGTWARIIAAWPAARLVGLTATPERLDGRGLGDVFEAMVQGPSTATLIAQGYLSPYRAFAPAAPDLSGVAALAGDFNATALGAAMDRPGLVGDIVATYQRLAPGARAIVFAAGIPHSQNIAAAFAAAGIGAAHLDGGTDAETRRLTIARFAAGEIPVLANVDLFGEGFDVPAIEAVILARPTQSLGLHLQQIGRALRPSPGKAAAIILDHAGNLARHGLPDEPRAWSLDVDPRSKRDAGAIPAARQCPGCYCVHTPAPACPECGHTYRAAPAIATRAGELVEVVKPAVPATPQIRQSDLSTLDELAAYGAAKGMKNPHGWAAHVLKARKNREQRA